MPENGTIAYISTPKGCNFCSSQATHDFKTNSGPWANGCDVHYEAFRAYLTLGIGKGQKLEVKS